MSQSGSYLFDPRIQAAAELVEKSRRMAPAARDLALLVAMVLSPKTVAILTKPQDKVWT